MKIILWTRPVTTIAAQIDSKTLFNTDLKKKKKVLSASPVNHSSTSQSRAMNSCMQKKADSTFL